MNLNVLTISSSAAGRTTRRLGNTYRQVLMLQTQRLMSPAADNDFVNVLKLTYFLILKQRALALFSLMERSLTWHSQLRFVSIFTLRYLTLLVRDIVFYQIILF